MLKKLSVWHTHYGKGRIAKEVGNHYEIDFGSETKKIMNDRWLVNLFLSELDMMEVNKERIRYKYRFLVGQRLEKDPILLYSLSTVSIRKIAIVMNQTVKTGKKQFLEIVGIDLLSSKTVKIIDTNGSQYKLHSYKKDVCKLQIGTVIQASFELFSNEEAINLLRITSQYEIIDHIALSNKYYESEQLEPLAYIRSFGEVFECLARSPGREFYTIVFFTDSIIKKYISKKNVIKYQIKMKNTFVDIEEPIAKIETLDNLHYRGMTIIKAKSDEEGKLHIKATKLLGDTYTEAEIKEMKPATHTHMSYDNDFLKQAEYMLIDMQDEEMEQFQECLDYETMIRDETEGLYVEYQAFIRTEQYEYDDFLSDELEDQYGYSYRSFASDLHYYESEMLYLKDSESWKTIEDSWMYMDHDEGENSYLKTKFVNRIKPFHDLTVVDWDDDDFEI